MSVDALKQVSDAIREAAVAAADPRAAVMRSLAVTPRGVKAGGVEHASSGRVLLLAVGKASIPMTAAALDILGGRLAGGLVVAPHGYRHDALQDPRVAVLPAGHPLPDDQGRAAAEGAVAMIDGMTESDLCLFLLSGGGSSLLPLPRPPISLSEKIQVTSLLLASGAEIREINTVRKHLSAIKGGQLAARCRGSIVTLAISDVNGDDLGFIASGPTVADPTTFADARSVLGRYGLLDRVPGSVSALLQLGTEGKIPETPKLLPRRFTAAVIASGRLAAEAAAEAALRRGYAPLVLTTVLAGEAREAGRLLAAIAREAKERGRPARPPACLIAAGETTVTVRGTGKGGRNQEIALAAAIDLAGERGILISSFATDGKEGNTEAAGAHASEETLAAGSRRGLDPRACLAANDSNAFLSAAGELIVTGPTGTNVNDITLALIEREHRAMAGDEERFAGIYAGHAVEYHDLVMHEDPRGNLQSALMDIVGSAGKTVVELGAGTGRVTGILATAAGTVLAFDRSRHMLDRAALYLSPWIGRNVLLAEADNTAIPLPDASADVVVEGWSFGHSVVSAADAWQKAAAALLAEAGRVLRSGGTMILIESLGTGAEKPAPPGAFLPPFYAWLEQEKGFTSRWIRTDYLFESLAKARQLMEFFFGALGEHQVLASGEVLVVPECTGLWWRRK